MDRTVDPRDWMEDEAIMAQDDARDWAELERTEAARIAWALSRCHLEGCQREGTEKLRDGVVCPEHLQAAFDAEYDRQLERKERGA